MTVAERLALSGTPRNLSEALAGAYYQAAGSGINMRVAAEALEAIRDMGTTMSDSIEVLDAVDQQIGRALDERFQGVLVGLRRGLGDQIVRARVEVIAESFTEGRDDVGWSEFLQFFAQALAEGRIRICDTLIGELSFPDSRKDDVERLQRWTKLIIQERWAETYELFGLLAETSSIPTGVRVRLYKAASEIQIYHFADFQLARRLLERAETLAADDVTVACGWGEYWQEQKEYVKAEGMFESALSHRPDSPAAYICMGELSLQREDLETAERWLEQAINVRPGEYGIYSALLRLYGHPRWLSAHESALLPLVTRMTALNPIDIQPEYSPYVGLGSLFVDSARFDEAHKWYRTAISIDPQRVGGHIAEGYCWVAEGDQERARAAFERALEVAPEAFAAHWAMAFICEEQEHWEEARAAYQEILSLHPPSRTRALAKLGEMEVNLGRLAEAEQLLLDALQESSNDSATTTVLLNLAYERLKRTDGLPSALDIYDRMRWIKGESYEAEYRNLRGNAFHDLADYANATQSYELAVRADPQKSVYHRNLATALRRLGLWGRMREELGIAFTLDGDERKHRQELATGYNEEANELFEGGRYAEAIAGYERAIALVDDDAVFLSNLSLAWERKADPGHRLQELERAVEGLERAARLKCEPAYSERLATLRRKSAAVLRYGEPILNDAFTLPICVEFSDDLVPRVDSQQGAVFIAEDIPALRERITVVTGLRIPGLRLRGNPGLASGTYSILLSEVPMTRGRALAHGACVLAPVGASAPDLSAQIDIHKEAIVSDHDPVSGEPCSWVPAPFVSSLDGHGIAYLSDTTAIARHIEHVVRLHVALLFGLDQAKAWIVEHMADLGGDLQSRIVVARALRALVRDGIPLTRSEVIAASLKDLAFSTDRMPEVVERLRMALAVSMPANASDVRSIELSEVWEAALESHVPLPPVLEHNLLKDLSRLGAHGPIALITRSGRHRAYLQRLIDDSSGTARPILGVLAEREQVIHATPEAGTAT